MVDEKRSNPIIDNLDEELEDAKKHDNELLDDDQKQVKDDDDTKDDDKDKDDKDDKDETKDKDDSDEDKDDDDDDKGEDKEPRKRPKRYIPIPQYQDEKKQWGKDKEALEASNVKVKELQSIIDKGVDKPDEKVAIKGWAEKHKMSEEAATELIDIVRKNISSPDSDLEEKVNRIADKVVTQESESYFKEEIKKDFLPEIKKQYPDATKAQINKAVEIMDEIAHTEKKYKSTSLDYIFFKEADQFADAFGDNVGVHGAERGSIGHGRATGLSAKDFKPDKKGNYDFKQLHEMEDSEVKQGIVSKLDAFATVAYVNSIPEDLEIRRDGNAVK